MILTAVNCQQDTKQQLANTKLYNREDQAIFLVPESQQAKILSPLRPATSPSCEQTNGIKEDKKCASSIEADMSQIRSAFASITHDLLQWAQIHKGEQHLYR